MNTNKLLALAAVALLTARTGLAQGGSRDWWGKNFVPNPPGNYFVAKETSLDAFGTYFAAERKFADLFQTSIRQGTWGGGAGLNYFLTRQIGIGGDLNIPDNNGNFVDSVSASLMARLPIEKLRLAPYAFGGGGRTTDGIWQWIRQAGVGLEYRLDKTTGIFIDGRYVWADKSSDSTLLRAGLRFVF